MCYSGSMKESAYRSVPFLYGRLSWSSHTGLASCRSSCAHSGKAGEDGMDEWEVEFAKLYVQHKGKPGWTYKKMAVLAGYPGKEETAAASVSRLLKTVKFKDILTELKEKIKDHAAEKMFILSAEQRREILSKIASDTEERTQQRISAIDVLNKMDGEYLNKTELSGGVEYVLNWGNGPGA